MQSGWLHEFGKGQTEGEKEPDGLSRRGFLHSGLVAGATAGAVAAQGLAGTRVAQAQQPAAGGAQTPIGAPWWPSRWGAQDEAGASNWITPAKVLAAARLIKTGKIYEMGRVYEAGMPLFGQRAWSLRIPGTPSGGPFGKNQLVYHDEFLSTEIGQVGTQFDGLAHIGCQCGQPGDMNQMKYYNGITELDMADAYGMKKLGMEKVKPFFTRGLLIDVAAVKGRSLNAGEEVTPADVQAALTRQGIADGSIMPGDALFFHTGWGSLWMKDNAKYNGGEPGPGMDAARWIVGKQPCVVGADCWAVEVVPNPNADLAFVVHNELITRNGIFLHENLDLSALAADRVYEFVYVFSPLRIKGATGSPGRPIAIV